MVFAKLDREKLMGSLESREQFEKFILSGQWMSKDSFAGEVAKEALVVFDPLGIAEETLKREKKAEAKADEEPRSEPEETTAKAEKEEALPEEAPRLRRTWRRRRRRRRNWRAAGGSDAAEASPRLTRGERNQ